VIAKFVKESRFKEDWEWDDVFYANFRVMFRLMRLRKVTDSFYLVIF
jgi:hypothetical protein